MSEMQKKTGREIGHRTKTDSYFKKKREIRDESQNFIVPLCTQHTNILIDDGNHSSIFTDSRSVY